MATNIYKVAIEELNLQDKIEIEWQPFQLNPDMPAEGEELRAHVARKYGSSREDSDRAREDLTKLGADYGFEFNYFDGMKIVNTLDAHILLDYAHQVGKQMALKMRFFSAFFTEQKDISNPEVLIQEAQAVGISTLQSQATLANVEIKNRVKNLEAQWKQMGVSGVPTVVFNRTSALTGAQPQETFKQTLLEIIKKQK
ncbi:DsbA family oxidoreductase [Psychromonas sp. KJ10-10]|uniref:DsbA family oxidoreductase n=1 Tax=Psychromonas sp. KJ10-10 TaxID=3391823 RepID=UPI0039B65669